MSISERFRIDAHIHLSGDDEQTLEFLEELDLRLLNICVAHGEWRSRKHAVYRDLAASHPQRYAWATSFDLPDWSVSERDYADLVIEALDRDVNDGAVAVKAWKNIGMELRRPDGSFALIDDAIFDPIYRHLAHIGVPMIMHIGEPLACWLPIEVASPHQSYYRGHPEWHMHGRSDIPSHAQLISARDRVLERHPRLRVVGAHLGSLEHDVAEVASRLDRYPNFAVDISARLSDLAAQDPKTVRDFFLAYQDRIIFGTDVVTDARSSSLSREHRAALERSLRETYDRYFRYLETSELLGLDEPASPGLDEPASPGLALPDEVLDRIYVENARGWFPGLAG
ncbi:MAG: amidohydrolase family protein [Spirochaetota bacterium]